MTRPEIQEEREATERETKRAHANRVTVSKEPVPRHHAENVNGESKVAHPHPEPEPVVEPIVVDGYVQALLARGRTTPPEVGFPPLPPPWAPAVGTVLNARQVGALADLDQAYFLATRYASEQKIQNYLRQMYLAFRVQMGAPVINP